MSLNPDNLPPLPQSSTTSASISVADSPSTSTTGAPSTRGDLRSESEPPFAQHPSTGTGASLPPSKVDIRGPTLSSATPNHGTAAAPALNYNGNDHAHGMGIAGVAPPIPTTPTPTPNAEPTTATVATTGVPAAPTAGVYAPRDVSIIQRLQHEYAIIEREQMENRERARRQLVEVKEKLKDQFVEEFAALQSKAGGSTKNQEKLLQLGERAYPRLTKRIERKQTQIMYEADRQESESKMKLQHIQAQIHHYTSINIPQVAAIPSAVPPVPSQLPPFAPPQVQVPSIASVPVHAQQQPPPHVVAQAYQHQPFSYAARPHVIQQHYTTAQNPPSLHVAASITAAAPPAPSTSMGSTTTTPTSTNNNNNNHHDDDGDDVKGYHMHDRDLHEVLKRTPRSNWSDNSQSREDPNRGSGSHPQQPQPPASDNRVMIRNSNRVRPPLAQSSSLNKKKREMRSHVNGPRTSSLTVIANDREMQMECNEYTAHSIVLSSALPFLKDQQKRRIWRTLTQTAPFEIIWTDIQTYLGMEADKGNAVARDALRKLRQPIVSNSHHHHAHHDHNGNDRSSDDHHHDHDGHGHGGPHRRHRRGSGDGHPRHVHQSNGASVATSSGNNASTSINNNNNNQASSSSSRSNNTVDERILYNIDTRPLPP